MKNLTRISLATLLISSIALVGCNNKKIEERLGSLEKRLEELEKKPALAARPPAPAAQEKAYQLPVAHSPVLGKKDANVSVVVFSDGQCPFCAGTDTLLREVVKDPELKEKVNVVFKNFPLSFHPNAKPAAKAALAASEQGGDKFWKMMEKIFANQQNLNEENFKKWAKELGLNLTKFEKSLKDNDGKYEEMIKADMDLGTNQAQVRGTPSIYVGGWELRERSVQGIKNLIKEKNLM
ncbi:MAG: thioredoxin domain-containing protein [Myxococcaceae bacterium]|nr:thioredoxin domain-containing protein [Myxococcaceae bacterium]MBH2006350.1 thioredoxin domain-containing protein [Myxococcaceae bacterium]